MSHSEHQHPIYQRLAAAAKRAKQLRYQDQQSQAALEQSEVEAADAAKTAQLGHRVVADVVLLPLIATGVGYAFDVWFALWPILTLTFLVLGMISAGFHIYLMLENEAKNTHT